MGHICSETPNIKTIVLYFSYKLFLSLHFYIFVSLLIYDVQFSSSPGVSILGGAIVAIVRIRTNPDPDDLDVYDIFYVAAIFHVSLGRNKAPLIPSQPNFPVVVLLYFATATLVTPNVETFRELHFCEKK